MRGRIQILHDPVEMLKGMRDCTFFLLPVLWRRFTWSIGRESFVTKDVVTTIRRGAGDAQCPRPPVGGWIIFATRFGEEFEIEVTDEIYTYPAS